MSSERLGEVIVTHPSTRFFFFLLSIDRLIDGGGATLARSYVATSEIQYDAVTVRSMSLALGSSCGGSYIAATLGP